MTQLYTSDGNAIKQFNGSVESKIFKYDQNSKSPYLTYTISGTGGIVDLQARGVIGEIWGTIKSFDLSNDNVNVNNLTFPEHVALFKFNITSGQDVTIELNNHLEV